MRPANERRCYFATTSFVGWAQAGNQPCSLVCSLQGRRHRTACFTVELKWPFGNKKNRLIWWRPRTGHDVTNWLWMLHDIFQDLAFLYNAVNCVVVLRMRNIFPFANQMDSQGGFGFKPRLLDHFTGQWWAYCTRLCVGVSHWPAFPLRQV